jgi:hypothetical protein
VRLGSVNVPKRLFADLEVETDSVASVSREDATAERRRRRIGGHCRPAVKTEARSLDLHGRSA